MDGAKPISNPLSSCTQLSTKSVNKACQFMHNPIDLHWQAVKRILSYLKGSITQGLQLRASSNFDILAYADADYAGCPDTRKSTSGHCIFLGNSLVSWSSNKQKVVARSITEGEYRSLALCTTEVCWIQNLLKELCVSLSRVPTILCDNMGATYLAINPLLHSRIKHVEIDMCFLREKIASRALCVKYVSTVDQLADLLTKGLSTTRFDLLKFKLNVSSPQFNLRGGERPQVSNNLLRIDRVCCK
ncbi:transmembrane signal receptor [Lithospermum erythrorhizon]|uniref:Transmembrane signal receptor n=1 Tax=Lithospermum erythrorhizon TaxID=34254 RepID=A0AAV3RAG1_LITER